MHIPKAQKLFISYAQADSRWLERLQTHLKPLERAGLIERWDDTCVVAGQVRTELIKTALREAQIVVLLVSAAFLAAEQLATEELPIILDAAERGQMTVLPLIVSPCLIDSVPRLAAIRPINSMERALVGLSLGDREKVIKEAAQMVMARLDINEDAAVPTPAPPGRSLPPESLDDISCRLLAGELMKQVSHLVGQPAPRLPVGMPGGRRLEVLLNVAAITNHTMLQTLRHHVEMIGILEERLAFLKRQQQLPIGQVVDFGVEVRAKEAQLGEEIGQVRDSLGFFIDQLQLLA